MVNRSGLDYLENITNQLIEEINSGANIELLQPRYNNLIKELTRSVEWVKKTDTDISRYLKKKVADDVKVTPNDLTLPNPELVVFDKSLIRQINDFGIENFYGGFNRILLKHTNNEVLWSHEEEKFKPIYKSKYWSGKYLILENPYNKNPVNKYNIEKWGHIVGIVKRPETEGKLRFYFTNLGSIREKPFLQFILSEGYGIFRKDNDENFISDRIYFALRFDKNIGHVSGKGLTDIAWVEGTRKNSNSIINVSVRGRPVTENGFKTDPQIPKQFYEKVMNNAYKLERMKKGVSNAPSNGN